MTTPISPASLKKKLNLIYTSDAQPGFFRKKWGKGFRYLTDKNEMLNCEKSLKRIKGLVIPPIWNEVWICKKDNGHLQSTGRDGRKRKQYLYHPEWTAYRQSEKFSRMLEFSEALPTMRKKVSANLKNKKWDREKVISLAIKIMDEHKIRIGNQQYADQNGTYGLTTLRRKHLDTDAKELTFSYKAKSNKYRTVPIKNPHLVKLIKQCSELPGYEVLTYKDKSGHSQSIDSSDVNEYIQQIMGESFSSKDFRTWRGTSMAVDLYEEALKIVEENPRKKIEPTLVKMVAKALGNTMSVCRKYYIHPHILEQVKNQSPQWQVNQKDLRWMKGYEMETQKLLKGLYD